MSTNNTVIDGGRGVMRCEVCGDEIPMPAGDIHWAASVMRAFQKAHEPVGHQSGQTRFSTPEPPPPEDEK